MRKEARSGGGGGLVIVYTGGGKGKTTAALGLAVRAVGHGWKVCMVQFVKGSGRYGEIEGSRRLAPNFELIVAGEGFVGIGGDRKPFQVHKEAAERALEICREKISSGEYQIVILDEVNCALALKLIRVKDVVNLLETRPSGVTLVLTGDKAPKKILEAADIVTEMREIKHPFREGLPAVKGIDF